MKKEWMKNIPNVITCLRIALVFVFEIYFIRSMYIEGLIVYGIAFLSDVIDGYLARRFGWVSDVGKLLDPFADKLMLITALVCLALKGMIPMWILILIGVKEFTMCLAGIILFKRGVVVQANIIGKISTGLWTLAIASSILSAIYAPLGAARYWIVIAAAAFAVFTGVFYGAKYLFVNNKKGKQGE